MRAPVRSCPALAPGAALRQRKSTRVNAAPSAAPLRTPAAGHAGGVPRRSALAIGALSGAALAAAAAAGLVAAGAARAAMSDTGIITRRGMAKFIKVRAARCGAWA
jgi:hypothetical protein